MTFNAKKFLTKAPATLAGWVRELPVEDLPVLARTVYELEDLREVEEQVDLQMLDDLISADPLMTAKLFGFVAKRRGKDVDSEAETVRAALLLTGISPFFKALGTHSVAQEMLTEHAEASAQFQEAIERGQRAARFAVAFASQRDDMEIGLLRDAAMLHALPELVVWLRAPALALEVHRQVQADPSADMDAVSKGVLNVSHTELRIELMKAWRLPKPLAELITGQANPDSPQARNVRLALLAGQPSHPQWEGPDLGALVRDIGNFLQLGLQPTWSLLKNVEQLGN